MQAHHLVELPVMLPNIYCKLYHFFVCLFVFHFFAYLEAVNVQYNSKNVQISISHRNLYGNNIENLTENVFSTLVSLRFL